MRASVLGKSIWPGSWHALEPEHVEYKCAAIRLYPRPDSANNGLAFNDAASILQYRYNGGFNNLNSFQGLYGVPATFFTLLAGINIDGYFSRPLDDQFLAACILLESCHRPWSGADNPIIFTRRRTILTFFRHQPVSANLQAIGLNTANNLTVTRITGCSRRWGWIPRRRTRTR